VHVRACACVRACVRACVSACVEHCLHACVEECVLRGCVRALKNAWRVQRLAKGGGDTTTVVIRGTLLDGVHRCVCG
jgi:hypothetical protein